MPENVPSPEEIERLIARAMEPDEPWLHEPGDKLVITVTDVDERQAEYGAYPAVSGTTVAASTEKGGQLIELGEARTLHAFRTVARSKVKHVQVGDTIAVVYLGAVNGKEYLDYGLKRIPGGENGGASVTPEPSGDDPEPEAAAEKPTQTDEIPF